MTNQARYGACLRRLRETRHLEQTTASERAGLTAEALEQIERGELSPTLEMLEGLAAAYEVTLGALIGAHALCRREHGIDLLCLLAGRSDAELRSAHRVVTAMFDDSDGVSLLRVLDS